MDKRPVNSRGSNSTPQPAVDWSRVETVMLDMDGTLLDLHYDNYFWLEHLPRRYATIKQMPVEAATSLLNQELNRARGSLEWYCLEYWCETLDIDIPALKQEITERIGFLPYAEKLLRYINKLAVETMIVTNAHRQTVAIKEDVVGLSGFVDTIWSSHDFGYAKEDTQFWNEFAKQQAFDPATTVFVDDNCEVLTAAKEQGIAQLVVPLKPDSQRAMNSANIDPAFIQITSLQQLIGEQTANG